MSDLTAWERKAKIRKGEPITQEFNGVELTFYPITMTNYEEFLGLKNVLALRQSSLAAKYLMLSYFSALWAVDYDSVVATGKPIGLFERFIRLLYLCLRLGYKTDEIFKTLIFDHDDPEKLTFIAITTEDGKTVRLTPQDISFVIRPLIAEQNGVELPDESFNPDLVATEEIMNKDNAVKLEYDTDTLISSVAYLSGINESEINNWTVLQFERRREAIERDKFFTLYKAAELGGMVKFPQGNPYQSWCFDTKRTSSAVIALSDFQKTRQGLGDVTKAIEIGSQNKEL